MREDIEMGSQISMFDGETQFKITKPLRLIELFGGYGSQSLALKYLGVPFEHWRLCEWAIPSIQAYKDLHFEQDATDYSVGMNKIELVKTLHNLGISSDYNQPLTQEKLNRYSESKLRTIYNNIRACHNLVSICNVRGEDLGIQETDKYCYLMTYSFPCFTADSLVLTGKGYKTINEIKIGDTVLTCDNTYQVVTKTFDNGIKPILKINAMAVDEIKCTNNHRFYVRTMSWVGHNHHRVFSPPYWKSACTLAKEDYLGIAINQNSIIPTWDGVDFDWSDGRKTRHKNQLQHLFYFTDFWWLIGRYMGDGWRRAQGGIIICCAYDELEKVTQRIDKLFNYNVVKERTVYKIHIPIKELSAFVSQFGDGAMNKHLTNTILDLPTHLLKAFLHGYISADGCFTNGLNKITSTSRELVYGIAQCVAKAYRTSYSVYCTKRPPKCTIEGRVVNQHNTYELFWEEKACKQDKAFYENGFIWFPIKSVTECGQSNVYDIEVKNNHSFTVQNTIVHNCQDISSAGLGKGMERGRGTRSGLLWEVERLLTETKELPQVLLMENVKQVVGQKNIKAFAEWVAFLDKLGYHSKWQVLNATDFSIPQNRERCFMVSVLGNYSYDFPMICRKRELYDFVDRLPENEINIGHASKTIINSIKKAASYIEAKTIRCGGRGSIDRHSWDIYSIDYIRTLTYYSPPLKNISITLLANKTGLGYSTQEKYFFYSTQEFFRLMGVKNEDYKKLKKAQSKSSLFHLAGDSIVTTCLMAIFGEMCDVDYKTKIEELTKNLTGEQKDDRNRYNENYGSN